MGTSDGESPGSHHSSGTSHTCFVGFDAPAGPTAPDAIRWQHVLWQGDTFNSTLCEKALPPVYFSPVAS